MKDKNERHITGIHSYHAYREAQTFTLTIDVKEVSTINSSRFFFLSHSIQSIEKIGHHSTIRCFETEVQDGETHSTTKTNIKNYQDKN